MNKAPANHLAIAVAQLNPIVGDVAGNLERARAARAQAAREGADIVAFSELFIAGYPPEDLVLKPAFQAACRAAVETLARETGDGGPAVLMGTPWVEDGKLYNAYALLDHGVIEAIRFKVNLPNYGVFDEKRVFATGPVPGPIAFRGVRLGLPICEDTWTDWGDYENVVETLAETGAELIVVPNGSPYWRDKADVRLNVTVARVAEAGLPLIYVNQVGGQDELVFDGASFALNADRSMAFQLPAFQEAMLITHWSRGNDGWRCAQGPLAAADEPDHADYAACMLGLRDYVDKNRFSGVVLGLSGGIDSALCAALAVDALGRRARALRDAAVPFHVAGIDRRRGGDRPRARRALRHRADRARRERPRSDARRHFRRRAARRHRGKSAGPRPRHHPDGDLQQIRSDGGDDRQQVGNVGRLRHALWRHEWRLQPDQGSLQDRGVSPGALAQCVEAARRARSGRRDHPRERHRAAADRGTARKPDRPGYAAALRRARSDSGAPGRARGAARRPSSPPVSTATP